MSFLSQVLASPTMTLWHGGNLDIVEDELAHKGGRWEYGPGLYLTTHYDTAKKYAKGSRKFYRVEVAKGKDIRDVLIPKDRLEWFMSRYVIKAKLKEIKPRLEKWVKEDGSFPANIFMNIILNEKAIKNTETGTLRSFIVECGADYEIVTNAFGTNKIMLVLYNTKKIVKKEVVSPKEKIEVYDLPDTFS